MVGAAACEARWFSLKQHDQIRLNPVRTAGRPDGGQRKLPAAGRGSTQRRTLLRRPAVGRTLSVPAAATDKAPDELQKRRGRASSVSMNRGHDFTVTREEKKTAMGRKKCKESSRERKTNLTLQKNWPCIPCYE
jgi:hypothetical protein